MKPKPSPPESSPRAARRYPMEAGALLDAIGLAVILLDARRNVTALNAEAERLLRLSEAASLGKPFSRVRPQAAGIEEYMDKAAGERRLITLREVRWESFDPEDLLLDIRVNPLFDPTGLPVGFLLVFEDRSLPHQAEAAAGAELQLSTLSAFSAGIAHEVKNPLGGIRGAAQLLRSRAAHDAEVGEFSDLIIRQTDRIARLVDDLMAFTRPRESLPMEEFSIHEVIDEALRVAEAAPAARRVLLERIYDPSLPLIRAHRAGLEQCFLNLVKNGLEAMEDRPEEAFVALSVSTRYLTALHSPSGARRPAPTLAVEVRDRGPGLDPAVAGQLFTPFQTTKPRGAGLGLAISRKIIHDHQGTLELKNAPGGGAVAVVLLPLPSN